MPFQVSPGINVSEIDLTSIVPAVSTTEAAVAGSFRWGPVETPVLVDTENTLVQTFTKPTNATADDFFTAANFLAYGNALYVSRAVNKDDDNNVSGRNAISIDPSWVTVTTSYNLSVTGTEPASGNVGDLWYSTTTDKLYEYDATVSADRWSKDGKSFNLTISNTAPTGANNADLWYSTSNNTVVEWDGAIWNVPAAWNITTGETKPAVANTGDLWYDTFEDRMYEYLSPFVETTSYIVQNTAPRSFKSGDKWVSAANNTVQEYKVDDSVTYRINNLDEYESDHSNGISAIGDWIAKYPGELGNALKVAVCPSASAWESTLTGSIALPQNSKVVTGTATLFLDEVSEGDIVILGDDREEFVVATVDTNVQLTLAKTYTSAAITAQTDTTRRWGYYNSFDLAPGTSDYISNRGGSGDEINVAIVDVDGSWTGTKNTVLEKFERLSLAADAKSSDGTNVYYVTTINNTSQYVYWAGHNTKNLNAGTTAGSSAVTYGGETQPYESTLVNGRDGNAPRDADYITAYDKFKNKETFEASILLSSSRGATVVNHLIDNIAGSRLDMVVVASPEKADVVDNSTYPGKEVDDIVTFRNSLSSSSYAILDSGWKYQYDKYNDVYRYVPLNGDTAGLMVRTDTTRDPWFSPAGFNRGQIKNVVSLPFSPNKAERDRLYKNDINPVVTFPGQGVVLYGDKTLLGKPSAFDRINVRRLFIVLEKAISTAAQSTLFEFNDEFTRSQFKNLIEPFLRDVQSRRGITDFKVVCDSSNNTGEVVDRNEFVGDIFIKPARSINFIQLNFVAVRSGVDFEEIVGSV